MTVCDSHEISRAVLNVRCGHGYFPLRCGGGGGGGGIIRKIEITTTEVSRSTEPPGEQRYGHRHNNNRAFTAFEV